MVPCPMKAEGGAGLSALCLFFVRACLHGKLQGDKGDFKQSTKYDDYVHTFADLVEKKDPLATMPFRSVANSFNCIFKANEGDNRSGKSQRRLPRVVRMRNAYLPAKNVIIVLGNDEKPENEALEILEAQLLADWQQRSRGSSKHVTLRKSELQSPGRSSMEQRQIATANYIPLRERLTRAGVTWATELKGAPFLEQRRDSLVIDDAILDYAIAGFTGVIPNRLKVTMTAEPPNLPTYVLEAKKTIPKPESNRRKVYLESWTPTIGDKGGDFQMTLGYTDFWTHLAIEKCMGRLHADMLTGKLNLFTFPRRLDTPVVVVTADNRVVLSKRGDVVRWCPLQWEISIGESIDGQEDVDSSGQIHPACAVRRGIHEELAIPKQIANNVDIKFVAVGSEWPLLFVNLITVAKLPTIEFAQLYDWSLARRDHEHTAIDDIAFEIESCLNVMIRGTYKILNRADTNARLLSISRMALLAALCNKFGYPNVETQIE